MLPTAEALLAAGATIKEGQYSTLDYNFNASVPAEMQGFINILQEVSQGHLTGHHPMHTT